MADFIFNIETLKERVYNNLANTIKLVWEEETPLLLYQSLAKYIPIKSGDLQRSFMIGNAMNIYRLQVSDTQIALNYGSDVPYANVQDVGGTVHPIFTDKMRMFLHAKFKSVKGESKLHVGDKLNIKLKGTQYFSKGMEDFENSGLGLFYDSLMKRIIKQMENS